MSYFITPRVMPLYYHYSNEPSICDAFDYSHAQYISNTFHIIISVFKPQFIHYTKYAKYAFLLLFSILVKGNSFHDQPSCSFDMQHDYFQKKKNVLTFKPNTEVKGVKGQNICLPVIIPFIPFI